MGLLKFVWRANSATQCNWEWFRMVVSEVPCSSSEYFSLAGWEEVIQVSWERCWSGWLFCWGFACTRSNVFTKYTGLLPLPRTASLGFVDAWKGIRPLWELEGKQLLFPELNPARTFAAFRILAISFAEMLKVSCAINNLLQWVLYVLGIVCDLNMALVCCYSIMTSHIAAAIWVLHVCFYIDCKNLLIMILQLENLKLNLIYNTKQNLNLLVLV